MAQLGFQLTGSGVKDCEGCGMPTMTGDLSKPAWCGDAEGECDNADDLDDTATPEHSGNRVWVVRAGTDGIGLDLFHVYAPDMDAARESAREAGKLAGFVFGDNFTVHALRDGEPIDWFARLGNNIVTDRPAVDVPKISAEDLDRAADLLAGLIFLAALSEIVEAIESMPEPATPWFLTPDGSPEREAVRERTERALRDETPYEGDGFSPYM